MEKTLFLKPKKEHLQNIQKFKDELVKAKEEKHGSTFIEEFDDLNKWLEYVYLLENKETLPSKDFVPNRQYFLINEKNGKIIGSATIRLGLNEQLEKYYGHIGYAIAPSERKKGYGTLILKESLKIAKEKGIKEVLITCKEDNIASEKIILKNGFIYKNTKSNDETGEKFKRFLITT